MLAVDPATLNRLAGNQWGQFIAGQCFAELVAQSLNDAAELAVAGSSDPKIEITQRGDGAWLLPDPHAIASTNLNAIDALPADFDLPIRLEAAATLIPRPATGPVDVIWGFDVDVRVQWIATDILSDIGLGVIQSEVNDSIAEKLSDPPTGFTEVERTEDHVRYRSSNWKDAPRSAAFSCHVSDVHVDDTGLVVLGSVEVKPPPSATFSATLPEWTFSGDCHTKNVRQVLSPLHVQVVGMDPRHEVYLVAEPVIEPAGTWSYTRRLSLPGASPPTLDVYFTRRTVPPTGGQSVYVYTNLGVRWINIGILPPRPPVTGRELLARTIDLISECMAISDRWGEGVMNLDWLVDPPTTSSTSASRPSTSGWSTSTRWRKSTRST